MSCLTPNIFTYFDCKPELLINQDFGRAFLYDFAIGIPLLQPYIGQVGGTLTKITNPYLTTVKLKRRMKRSNENPSEIDLIRSNPRKYANEAESLKFMEGPDGSINRVLKCSNLKYGQVPGVHSTIHKCCRCNTRKKIDSRNEGYNQRRKVCCPCKQRRINRKKIFPRTCGLAKDLLKNDCKSDIYKLPSFGHDYISKIKCCRCPQEERIFDETEATNFKKMERQDLHYCCSC